MTRYVVAIVVLTLVYALALGSFHAWDLLIGASLSAALLFASRRFVFGADDATLRPVDHGLTLLGRAMAFVPFAVAVFREILVGNWEVTLVTLHLRPLVRPGIVAVPIGERTPTGVAVWAVVTGLPPGSFFVDVDRERGGSVDPRPGRPRSRSLPPSTGGLLPPLPEQGLPVSP